MKEYVAIVQVPSPVANRLFRSLTLGGPHQAKREVQVVDQSHRGHLEVCSRLMKAAEIDALLLSKPANLIYPTGSGRLCAYALLIAAGKRRFPSLE